MMKLGKEYSEPKTSGSLLAKCSGTSRPVKQELPTMFSVGSFLYLKKFEMS